MDWTFDDIAEDPQPAQPAREHLPEGDYVFEIKRAAEDAKQLSLRLAPEDRRYGLVFVDLPKGKEWAKRIAAGLPAALGVSAAEWGGMTPADLEGRQIRARIYHKVTDAGRLFVNVGEFLRPEEPPPAAAKPARTPRQRAEAASATAPDDDIPF